MKNKIFEVLNEKIFVWTIACDSQFLRRPDQNGGVKETAGLKKQNRLLRFLFLICDKQNYCVLKVEKAHKQ
jgi:hypothetical protein